MILEPCLLSEKEFTQSKETSARQALAKKTGKRKQDAVQDAVRFQTILVRK
jgi:hypothetical protein